MSFVATWKDLEIIVSQREKDKQHTILFTCGIKEKEIKMNLFKKQKKIPI